MELSFNTEIRIRGSSEANDWYTESEGSVQLLLETIFCLNFEKSHKDIRTKKNKEIYFLVPNVSSFYRKVYFLFNLDKIVTLILSHYHNFKKITYLLKRKWNFFFFNKFIIFLWILGKNDMVSIFLLK